MSRPGSLDGGAFTEDARRLLEREAVYLDERRWDEWLALYTEDCRYWMPAWRTEDALTSDPQAELSHYYYASRAGLEDRILRINSGLSPASTPLPRTTHIIGNVQLRGAPAPAMMQVRSSWVCHVYFVRARESHAFFGHNDLDLVRRDGGWRIAGKKIVLQNDYVPTMLDFYCT